MEITNPDVKTKSFWTRPEGTTGMLTLAGLGVGLYFALPFIITLLTMATIAIGKAAALALLCGAIYVAAMFVTSPLCHSMFKSAMRAITGWFVEIDPIGIMRNYIDVLKGKKEIMDKNVSALSGQIRVIKNKIEANNQGIKNALDTAKVARDKNMQMQFSLQARRQGRLEKSNLTYQQMYDKMNVLYRALKKYQEATEVTIIDMTEEVQVKSDERAAIIAASKAMNGAMSILRGAGPEKELFDQAMEFTVQDYGRRLGEIDDFMDTTKSILEGMDLQNGVYDAQAMEKLAAWEQRADSLVLGGDKRLMLENLSQPVVLLNTNDARVTVGATQNDASYDKFFKS